MIIVNTRGKKDHKYKSTFMYYLGTLDNKYRKNAVIKKHKHAIIFVHGYNSKTGKVLKAYNKMNNHIKTEKVDVYGFLWANRGKWWAYFGDLIRSKEGGKRLKHLIRSLKIDYGYEKVSIICHSMGSYLVMNMLSKFGSNCEVHRVCIMAGDTKVKKYRRWKKYGLCWEYIEQLDSYYSKHDLVLKWIAPRIRKGKRIGGNEMPEGKPDNYYSINAQMYSAEYVRHGSYKNMGTLLKAAIQRILK